MTLGVDVPGANTTGNGERGLIADSRAGADFFRSPISLQNNLLAGNITAINSTGFPALKRDGDNLIYHISHNGANQTAETRPPSPGIANNR